MAKRRELKKDINYLTYELLEECFTYQYFHEELDIEQLNEVATKILDNRNNLVGRINHVDGKDNPKLVKTHFKKIRQDVAKSIEALDQLESKKTKK